MKSHLSRFIGRGVPVTVLAMVLAGCDGDSKSPSGPPPGVPVITNLVLTFKEACTVGGVPGKVLDESFDYEDSDDNVSGGKVQTTATFNPSGSPTDVVFTVPSNNVTITGTTSGTIHVSACVRFGEQSSITVAVALVDAANNTSNVLSTTANRPAGAPELSGSADPVGAMERLRPK